MAKYSILEYARNKLGNAATDKNLKGMLTAMLDYGTTAQTYFEYNATRPANGNWVSVTASGGTLPDGFSYGLYYPGDTVTLTAPATDSAGRTFGAWQAADGSVASTLPTFACTVGATDERYTAVYYSVGLAFTSNGDGTTCTLTGIGTCTDTVINIPPTNSAGETVTTIGQSAFQRCTSLESVTLPNGITQINGNAFQYCSKLTSINLPDSITVIGTFAFDGSGLTDVVLPAEMEVINSGVFMNCTQLKSVVIGKNTDLVTSNAFANCPALESITVVEGNPYYKVIDNCLIYTDSFSERHLVRVWGNFTIPAGIKYIGEYAFDSCKNLARITLPAGVIGINGFAFYNCTGLTSIVIPKSVTFIGSYAFENCTALTTIVYQDTAAKWAAITKDTDWNASTGDYTVYCTDGTISKDGNTTTHSANLDYESTGNGTCMVSDIGTCTDSAIVIPTINPDGELVTEIGQEAFQNATITSVTIPAAITSIPETAFAGCSALESITVAEGNTTYRAEGNCLIRKADNTLVLGCVNSVIPSGITAIGDNAFNGRAGLTRIVIPTSVTSIGNDAFKGCTALDTIVYQGTKTEWGTVTKGTNWNASTDAYTVYCTDGTISKDGTITTTHSAGLRFVSNNGGTCELASIGTCTDTAIVIPPISPNGDLVTVIGISSFGNQSQITAVTIPDCVTSIEGHAFMNCRSLASITIPDGVTTINSYTFSGCTALASVTLPDGLKEILDMAFQNCTSLPSIDLPANLEIIEQDAFAGSGLTSISIPDKVWFVATGAFADCDRLTAIHIGNVQQDLGLIGAFMGCSAIESITVAEGNLYYEVIDNCLIRIDGNRKALVIGHKDGVIPNGINIITAMAFYGWTELESITIPTDVKTIAYSAFEDCTNLKSIVIPASVETMESGVFNSCSSLTEIFFQGTTEAWKAMANANPLWNETTGEYIVYCTDGMVSKDGTTTTAYPTGLAFTSNTNSEGNPDGTCTLSGIGTCTDTVINIPPISPAGDLVTAIGDYVFDNHTSLTSVTIPDRVTSIGYSAFRFCANLTDITIPDSVESIGDLAFSYCEQLKRISIGAGVTSITPIMFNHCPAIETITVAAGNPKYRSGGDCVIQYKDVDENNVSIDVSILVLGCKTSVIPNGITAIGTEAFAYCTGLASITIPDDVTVIGYGAFYGCTNLTSVVLPDGLTTIDVTAFASCTKLESITIPDSVTDIAPVAFWNCSALTSVTLPEGLKNLGEQVFMDCTELTSIVIPESVTEIYVDAFNNCTALTTVVYQGTTTQWTAMKKATGWDTGTPENLVIYCTDGTVDKAGNVTPLPETGSDTDPDPAA